MNLEMEQALGPEETERLQGRLWALLTRQAALYTLDTSLPESVARELLASVKFSLEWYLEATGQSVRTLLTGDLEGILRQAEALLTRQVVIAKQRYALAKATAPVEGSQAMENALRDIDLFFHGYDTRYFAHQAPCNLDYPLCQPMAAEGLGVLYVREYLERLILENAFLSRFDWERVGRVLGATLPFDRQAVVNLYEPVAAAALGLTVIDGDLYGLDMTAAGQDRLTRQWAPLPPTARREALHRAAETLARRMELTQAAAAYLAAVDLWPRVEAVLDGGGDWQGLFPAFS
ncbi:MAG: DUF6179 domain-containing protein [Oscillibacter sp.]